MRLTYKNFRSPNCPCSAKGYQGTGDKKDAKICAEAEARAKAEADQKALFVKAGIRDTPAYTLEMVKAANTMLAAPTMMMLNRVPAAIQLSAIGKGVMTALSELAGWIAGALPRGAEGLRNCGRVLGGTVMTLWSLPVGESSDNRFSGIPFRFRESMALSI